MDTKKAKRRLELHKKYREMKKESKKQLRRRKK